MSRFPRRSFFSAILQRKLDTTGISYANVGALLIAFLIQACGPVGELSEDDVAEDGWNNFQTAAASDRNYDVYWLGREFQAAGHTFRGPDANSPDDPVGEVEGGGLGMYYAPDPYIGDLKLVLYSRDAWESKQQRPPEGRFEEKRVVVAGESAILRTRFYDPGFTAAPGDVIAQILTIDVGTTVVEATTGSVIPATPGPEPNPLIDEATFLAVMDELRPYPE